MEDFRHQNSFDCGNGQRSKRSKAAGFAAPILVLDIPMLAAMDHLSLVSPGSFFEPPIVDGTISTHKGRFV